MATAKAGDRGARDAVRSALAWRRVPAAEVFDGRSVRPEFAAAYVVAGPEWCEVGE